MNITAIALSAQTLAQGGQQEIVYPDPVTVTPGTVGFLFTFFIAVATILLARGAFKRVRRLRAAADAVDHHPIPVRRTAHEEPQTAAPAAGAEVSEADSAADPHTH